LPEGFSLSESANLGLQIVRTLTENELKGSINLVRTDRGTEAQLKFPL
jgi:two-component sensor histidine kinase